MQPIEKIVYITMSLLKMYGHSGVKFLNKDGVPRSIRVSLHADCRHVAIHACSYDSIGRESQLAGKNNVEIDLDTVLSEVRDMCTKLVSEDAVVSHNYSLEYIHNASIPHFLVGRDLLIKYVSHTACFGASKEALRPLIQLAILQAGGLNTMKDLDNERRRLKIGKYEEGSVRKHLNAVRA